VQIENLTVVLRPRNGWEAIDLGFMLARQHFWRLWLLWWLPALPLFCLLQLGFHAYGIVPLLLFWGLKPLYEQSLLYYLSRVVFGEYPSVSEMRKRFFGIAKTQLFYLLTWRRLSFSRSADMAVHLLEGLSGGERKERLRILHSYNGHAATWLTIILYHFEALIWMGVILLVTLLVPEEMEAFSGSDLWADEGVFQVINQSIYVLAMSFVAPFFVGAGFALYLSARTRLEGWDVELAFKKLAQRTQGVTGKSLAASLSLFVMLSFGLMVPVGEAAESDEAGALATRPHLKDPPHSARSARDDIRALLQEPDWGVIETYHRWDPIRLHKGEVPEPSDFWRKLGIWLKGMLVWLRELVGSLASLIELLFWLIVISLIIWLAHRYTLLDRFFSLLGSRPTLPSRQRPNLIRDLALETLPEEIMVSVRQALAQKDIRLALSLLYRGALRTLVQDYQIKIPDSATEHECVEIVNRCRSGDESRYFRQLTRLWLLMAWAGREPDAREVSRMAESWEGIYGSA